jgi:F0F1-type ATP synthase membrane subunit b/b'
VEAAKKRIAADLAAARRDIESSATQLASEIVQRVLQTKTGPSSPAREAR